MHSSTRIFVCAVHLAAAVLGGHVRAQPATKESRSASVPGDHPRIVAEARHAGRITAIAWSPDGKLLASGGGLLTVKVWDSSAGREVRTLASSPIAQVFGGDPVRIISIAWSPSGKTVAAVSPRQAIVWDAATGDLLREEECQEASAVAFTAAGKAVVLDTVEDRVALREIGDRREVRTEKALSLVRHAALSTGANRIAVIDWLLERNVCEARLFDGATGKEIPASGGKVEGGACLAISPDGRLLAAGTDDTKLVIYEAATGKKLQTLRVHRGILDRMATDLGAAAGHPDALSGAAFSPDGKLVAGARGGRSGEGFVKVWEVESGREVHTLGKGQAGFSAAAWSPDGKRIAAGRDDGVSVIWDALNGKEVHVLGGRDGGREVFLHALSGDRRTIAVNWSKFTIEGRDAHWKSGTRILDFPSLREIASFPHPNGKVLSMAMSPDGRLLAEAFWETTKEGDRFGLRLLDNESGKEVRTIPGGEVHNLGFLVDGNSGWTGLRSGAKVIDLPGGKVVALRMSVLDLSADGRTVASCDIEKVKAPGFGYLEEAYVFRAKLRDLATGKETRSFSGEKMRFKPLGVTAVAFSPDGKAFAAAGTEGAIAVWDVETGKVRMLADRSLPSSEDANILIGTVLAWSPDGRLLASGSLDRTVRLWDPAAGKEKEMVILRGHSSAVASLAFIGGGKVLLSSSPDGNLRGWRGGPGGDKAAEPEVVGGEVFSLQFFPDGSWAAVTPNGLFDSSAGADCPRLHGVDGTEVIPIDHLRDRHRPGLLSAALVGR